jgi:hypothetical protein
MSLIAFNSLKYSFLFCFFVDFTDILVSLLPKEFGVAVDSPSMCLRNGGTWYLELVRMFTKF